MPKEGSLVPADVPSERIQAALRKHKGVIRHAAEELKLNRESLRLRIGREPELAEFRRDQFVDTAEERIADLADGAKSEVVQLRTAQFVLTTLGADRGWRKTKDKRLPLEDLRVIHTALNIIINRHLPPEKREIARSDFREEVRKGFASSGATGFQRTA